VFREQSFFNFDKSELRPEAKPVIELISDLVRIDAANPYVLIVGHTDAVGLDDYNDALASRRAATVLQLLTSMGIDPKHLHTAAMGRRQPLASNATSDGQSRNRRVEFFIAQSYQANMVALAQIPVRSDWVRGPSSEPDQGRAAPSEDVEIHDSDGKKASGVSIRPPRTIILRDF
jgi:hypothetical protein